MNPSGRKRQRCSRTIVVAAWALFTLLLLVWFLLRSRNDNIQPVDGLLFLSLLIQVWLALQRRS
jgi:hypothetical protein